MEMQEVRGVEDTEQAGEVRRKNQDQVHGTEEVLGVAGRGLFLLFFG